MTWTVWPWRPLTVDGLKPASMSSVDVHFRRARIVGVEVGRFCADALAKASHLPGHQLWTHGVAQSGSRLNTNPSSAFRMPQFVGSPSICRDGIGGSRRSPGRADSRVGVGLGRFVFEFSVDLADRSFDSTVRHGRVEPIPSRPGEFASPHSSGGGEVRTGRDPCRSLDSRRGAEWSSASGAQVFRGTWVLFGISKPRIGLARTFWWRRPHL